MKISRTLENLLHIFSLWLIVWDDWPDKNWQNLLLNEDCICVCVGYYLYILKMRKKK